MVKNDLCIMLKPLAYIKITCPCDVYSHIPHICIVKLGYTIFLLFDPEHRLWVLTCTHNQCFEDKDKKGYLLLFSGNLSFFTDEKIVVCCMGLFL